MQFIGELYKRKMLTCKIMHDCIRRLIALKNEESLESLCKLLAIIGKDLELETNEKLPRLRKEDFATHVFMNASCPV